MSPKNIKKFFSVLFEQKTIGIIGDVMLDQFIWGHTHRLSPEAPVPIVSPYKESCTPGGAANVAVNIAGLCTRADLVGIIGKDSAGDKLRKECERFHLNTKGLIESSKHPTTTKTRIIAEGQHVVRIDQEKIKNISGDERDALVRYIAKHVSSWDVIVVSDYAKGCISREVAQTIMTIAREFKKPIVCDVKPIHAECFRGATVFAPNEKEAYTIANVDTIYKAGKIIRRTLNSDVVITRGAEGMDLFYNEGSHHFDAIAREIGDVTGAGDTVTAVLAVALAIGVDIVDACAAANVAAGIVVGKTGTAAIASHEFLGALEKYEK